MLDDRTQRAGEAAAAARRRAFSPGDAEPQQARPLGVVPILILCIVGAVVDTYAVMLFEIGFGFDVVSVGMAGFALVAASALALEHAWAWTLTWIYLALHFFLYLLTATMIGPGGFGLAVVYALALTYATGRRAVEVTEQ